MLVFGINRLYEAPVDPALVAKPVVDKGPAQSRSTIRRHRLGRGSDVRDQVRERRRRLLATASAYLGAEQPTHTHLPAMMDDNGLLVPAPPRSESERPDRTALIDIAARMGIVDERASALFNDRFSQSRENANPSRQEDNHRQEDRLRYISRTADERRERREREDLHQIRAFDDGSVFIPAERMGPLPITDEIVAQERAMLQRIQMGNARRGRLILYDHHPAESRTEPYTVSSIRSTQAPDHPSRSSTTSPATAASLFRRPPTTSRVDPRAMLDEFVNPSRRRRAEQMASTESSRLDGLGDRTRSLSPEGDNVWDTLLTTLTPDPQPPSVGSSFAASASGAATQSTNAATQSTAARSSRTSFSIPEIADNSYLFDPICEFNSDTDEDHNDDDNARNASNSASRTSRRWADIARYRNSEDNIDAMGNEAAMQRIVRRIARREQIPDSWWAEVGLTSSLGRDLYRQAHHSPDS
ncbi:hypothetical protein QBC43DRAFT_57377 [Cladorrhinum sp. PSN259]|nr:hypothetical protein QBC43DRAFT_57377 [Cladorrhinum sp. PSN259]